MATKSKALETKLAVEAKSDPISILNDMVLLALPTPLFKALSDEAAKRQKTLAEFLAEAVSTAIKTPALLTENKE